MFNINNVFLVFLTVWAGIDLALGSRDINSGCPMWGCLPWGTFSLSAGIPETDGLVKWSAEVDHVADSSDVFNSRGCVSDQIAVVCATQSGYVSLDPASGKQFWNYTTTTSPYLPVMDIYGDVIGMDRNELLAIEQTGSVNRPINISVLQPAFSIMLANDSILLLTASRADANQIVTYSTDGIVSGAIALDGTVERVKGTFIPTSQPIIAGYRAYLIAQFMPHNLSTPTAQGDIVYDAMIRRDETTGLAGTKRRLHCVELPFVQLTMPS